MTLLPSPIPHPLDYSPFDVPGWAREALESVVGVDWPDGDEAATWNVADRWYALARTLAGPHDEATAAAAQIMASYHNDGFRDAWQELAGDPSAPLNALLEISDELGALVEDCGRAIEAAKLEAWIEIGLFLIELIGMTITVALTLGAASPAAGGLIAATRITIQQIFRRLVSELSARPASSIDRHVGTKDDVRHLAVSSAEMATRRLFPPSTPAAGHLAVDSTVDPAVHQRPSRPADVDSPGHRRVSITADAVLRRSYGSANGPPGAAAPPAEGATRRIPRSEWERLAQAPPPPADPGSQTVKISPPLPPTQPLVAMPLLSPAPTTGASPEPSSPRPPATPPISAAPHFGHDANSPRSYEENRYREYASFLATIAEETRAKIRDLGSLTHDEFHAGSMLRGAELHKQVDDLQALLGEIDAESARLDGLSAAPPAPTASPGAVVELAPSGVLSDDRSALTGDGGPLPISRTRRYDTYGGLRTPLAVHQKALEDAMPHAGDGRAARLADPRSGRWFRLANDGGPEADPTRGLNCIDGVLALYDTYLHGRPRVSAPRTFDANAHGDPTHPTGGEWHGPQRIEQTTGAAFQNLCPFLGAADPATAKLAVDAAMQNLTNHLHNSGHGAFAFILTDLEGGGCHAWAAINQNGTVLFLDPQVGHISEETPLYHHRGIPSSSNVISMDALVLDAQARPAPLPYHGPGQWTGSAALPTGSSALPTGSAAIPTGLDDPESRETAV